MKQLLVYEADTVWNSIWVGPQDKDSKSWGFKHSKHHISNNIFSLILLKITIRSRWTVYNYIHKKLCTNPVSYGARTRDVILVGQKCTGTESWGVRYISYHISTNMRSMRLSERPTSPKFLTSETNFSNYLSIVDAYSKIPKLYGMERINTEEVMDKLDMFQPRFEKINKFVWWYLERILAYAGTQLPPHSYRTNVKLAVFVLR